jgi:peroxiredoxin
LAAPKLVVIVAYNLAVSETAGFASVKEAVARARNAGYSVIGLSASGPDEVNDYKSRFGLDFDFYFCDMTTLKTIIRSNPGIMEWRSGVIQQKLHWSDAHQLKLD